MNDVKRIEPRTLKGFRDYLPETMIPREWLIDTARRVYRSYGFSPIDEKTACNGIGGVLVVCNDVTDRHRAFEALRTSEERLRLALSAGVIGTWDWDVQTDRVFADERFAQAYAVDPMAASAGGLTLAIAAVEGNVLTPWLMGRVGQMNTVAVFVSLLFWGWIWGVWGLLLAVPIMAAAKAVCERIEDLSSYAELLKE